MTNEEAIKHIKAMCQMLLGADNKPISDTYYALEMALEKLSAEPCVDAISRADVIDAIGSWLDSGEWRYTNATEYLKKRVKNLPPVHAEPHISCDGCEYEHYKEFNERCRYCCRGKNDKYYAEEQA